MNKPRFGPFDISDVWEYAEDLQDLNNEERYQKVEADVEEAERILEIAMTTNDGDGVKDAARKKVIYTAGCALLSLWEIEGHTITMPDVYQ